MTDLKKMLEKQEKKKKDDGPVLTSIRVKASHHDWVEKEAKRLQVSKAKLFSLIVAEYVEGHLKKAK